MDFLHFGKPFTRLHLTGYGHVLTLYEITRDFFKKNVTFFKNENALTFLFFKVMSSDFEDFWSGPETFISGVFCARAGPEEGIL